MVFQHWRREGNDQANILLIIFYGISILLAILQVEKEEKIILFLDLIVSMLLLFLYYLKCVKKNTHQFSIMSFLFLTLVTITILINGINDSFLYPTLYILPVLYGVLNYSMRNSLGITLFAITTIWILLLHDPLLINFDRALGTSIFIIVIQMVLGLLVLEYSTQRKNLARNYVEYKINQDKIKNNKEEN